MATLYKRDLPEHDAMVANVLAVYERSNDAERAHGAVWYAEARQHAMLMADIAGIPMVAAAGAIACLSPQVSWPTNLAEAYRIITAHADGESIDDNTFVAYRRNVHKAWACVEYPGDWAEYVRGPKVSAFHRAIVGLPGGPCIDRHATRVATGYGYDAVTDSTYTAVQDAYVIAAAILSIDVHTLQATTWLTCKRELASTIGQVTFGW